MKDGWVDRLWIAIKDDGRSERAISLEARLGPNYLGQTRGRGSSPVSDKLNSILDVLGESAAIYVMTGVQLTPAAVKALNALSDIPEHLRERVMGLLLALAQEQIQEVKLGASHPDSEEISAGDQPKAEATPAKP